MKPQQYIKIRKNIIDTLIIKNSYIQSYSLKSSEAHDGKETETDTDS
jgi:hypothetical protein